MSQQFHKSHRGVATRIAVLLMTSVTVACGAAEPAPTAEPAEIAARPTKPVPKAVLSKAHTIEARGRQLAAYEQATTTAGLLLRTMSPDTTLFDTYLAVPDGQTWHVYFGRLSESRDSFETAYAFDCIAGSCSPGSPPAEPSAVAPLAAAIKTASGSFTPKADSYNASVFAETNGTISVYVVPGNFDPDAVLLGGDYRISVSANGSELLKVVELHKAVLRFPSRVPEGIKTFGTVRTNIIGDLPAGTDVSFIMRNPHLAPHTVIGPKWTSRITASGALAILGETDRVLADQSITPP